MERDTATYDEAYTRFAEAFAQTIDIKGICQTMRGKAAWSKDMTLPSDGPEMAAMLAAGAERIMEIHGGAA